MWLSSLSPHCAFLFLVVLCTPYVPISGQRRTDRMKGEMLQIFELLKQGDTHIRLDPNHRDVVRLIGNTGTGKPTLGLILTTDCTGLESYYTNGIHLIRDVRGNGTTGGKIGTKTIVSKTIFPELMVNPENGVAFYDCPGFRDTRKNTSIEFANTLFYKKITDHARSVKVLILVNYASVTPAANREDIPNLLKSVLSLLKSTHKFNNSVGMVATKVGVQREADEVVQGIKDYLAGIKYDVQDVLKIPEDVPKAENLIDSLIEDGKNDLPKIHFTWVPTHPGRLSELPEMMEARERIGDIVYNGLDYVDVTPDEFGYPFSPEARELETFILREIDSSTRKQMYKLAEEFRVFWANKMADPSTTDVEEILRDLKDAKELLQTLIQAENTDMSLPKTKDLISDVLEVFKKLGIHNRSESVDLQLFEDQDRFLDLLQKVHGSVAEIGQSKWIQPFERALGNLQAAIDWFQTLTELGRQLCLHVAGNSSEPCESPFGSTSVSSATYVDDKNFRQVFATLKQKFGTAIPTVPIKKFNTDYKSLTVKFLNGMIHRTSETRTRIVQAFVTGAASAIQQQFLKEVQDRTVDELKGAMVSLANALTEITRYPSNGTVTPNGVLMGIQAALTSAGIDNVLSPESIQIMRHQIRITEFLVSAGSPELEKMNRSDTLRPLEWTTAFLTQALDWFNFLDLLQENLSAYNLPPVQEVTNDSATKANYVVRKAILPALEEFSTLMGLQTPPRDSMNPTHFYPFVSHLNDILFRAWSHRKDYLMSLLDELARGMISIFRSKTICQENVTAFRSQVPDLIQIMEDKEWSLARNSSSQQTSPAELAKLYEDILNALTTAGSPSFSVDHLQKIRDQQDVFSVLAQVTPQLADLNMTRASRKLQPVTSYLRQLVSWYDFIYDLQSALLGLAGILNSSLEFDPQEIALGVNESSWYKFLSQSADFVDLSPPPAATNILDEQGAVCLVNETVHAVYKSKSTLLKSYLGQLVNKLMESVYLKAQVSHRAARFVQFMRSLGDQFSHFTHTTTYEDMVAVQNFVHDLDTRLGAVVGIGNEVLETLETLKEQSSIFGLLKLASPEFSKMNTTELMDPFGQVRTYINDSVKWFNYLEEIRDKLSTYEIQLAPSAPNSSFLATPMFQVSGDPGRLTRPLRQFTSLLNITRPNVRADVPDGDVFQRHLSAILFRAWTQRTEEVTESAKAFSRSVVQHFFKLTSRLGVKDLKDKTVRALNAFRKLAHVDDMDPSLQSGGAFADLLATTLADLRIPIHPTMNQLFTHVEKQDEVLGILGQVSSSWSHIDLRTALQMLFPIIEHLDHASSWFEFVSDLKSKLERYALKSSRIMSHSVADQALTGSIQNHEIAYQVIQQLASVLELEVPLNLELVLTIAEHRGLLQYTDRLTQWVRRTRIEEVKQLVEETAVLLVRQMANHSTNGSVEAPNYKGFVQSTKDRLKDLCESANRSMGSSELASYIEQGLLDIFQTIGPFEVILNSIAKQDEVLQILATVNPKFAKIDSRAVLAPLQDVTFVADTLIWFEFLDKVAVPLCNGHRPTERPPMTVWVTAENALDALSSMSRTYSVPLPRRAMNTTRGAVFLNKANNLFYCAWDLHMGDVLALTNQLANNITACYDNQAENVTNINGFLLELKKSRAVFRQFQELRVGNRVF